MGKTASLSDRQVRAAHRLYHSGALSMFDLGRRLALAGHFGSPRSAQQTLYDRFRRLGLPLASVPFEYEPIPTNGDRASHTCVVERERDGFASCLLCGVVLDPGRYSDG